MELARTIKKGHTSDGREGFAILCPVISALGDYWCATAYYRDPTAIFGIRELSRREYATEESAEQILNLISGEVFNGRYRCAAKLSEEFGWIPST